MARFGVIDLGSNSVRLVVYELKNPADPLRFRTVVDEKKMAGLSAYVVDGRFSEAGIARAVSILRSQLKTARTLNCDRIDIFATAVLRNCDNSAAALRAIEEGIEHPINLLSAKEEAHLGFAGARLGQPLETGTLIDIGGGSTELTVVRAQGDAQGVSLPQGSVSSYAQFVSLILPTSEECALIDEAFRSQLATLGTLKPYRTEHLFGIGGSVRAVAKMQTQSLGAPVKPPVVTAEHLDALFQLLKDDPSTFAHNAVKACPDRVHTLVPGMVIVRALMRAVGARTVTVCKHGIREGYLIERMLG